MSSAFKRQVKAQRLASKPICHYCGVALSADTATLEHIVPRSIGGTHSPYNVVLACGPCNAKRADRLVACYCKRCHRARRKFTALRNLTFGDLRRLARTEHKEHNE